MSIAGVGNNNQQIFLNDKRRHDDILQKAKLDSGIDMGIMDPTDLIRPDTYEVALENADPIELFVLNSNKRNISHNIKKEDGITGEGQQTRKDRFEEELFESAAPGVKDAWDKAAETTGADGLGMDPDGKLQYLSRIKVHLLLENKNVSSVFGNTVDSALNFSKNALESIMERLESNNDVKIEELLKKEKAFYEEFIENLNQIS